jgi:hypothetical protein
MRLSYLQRTGVFNCGAGFLTQWIAKASARDGDWCIPPKAAAEALLVYGGGADQMHAYLPYGRCSTLALNYRIWFRLNSTGILIFALRRFAEQTQALTRFWFWRYQQGISVRDWFAEVCVVGQVKHSDNSEAIARGALLGRRAARWPATARNHFAPQDEAPFAKLM